MNFFNVIHYKEVTQSTFSEETTTTDLLIVEADSRHAEEERRPIWGRHE
jgi:hypothetical protein